jgi:dienelactone hydrolase
MPPSAPRSALLIVLAVAASASCTSADRPKKADTRPAAAKAPPKPPPLPAVPPPKPKPTEVTFTSHGKKLYGYITKPTGAGPFPALLYNHGSEQKGGQKETLRDFFVSKGFVFFIPHRSGHGKSQGQYYKDAIANARDKDRAAVKFHEEHAGEVADAFAYLKTFPYVDKGRIAVGGCSFGGIQTLLAAERGGYRAAIDWAGGSMSWRSSPQLQRRLTTAVDRAKVPIFFLQAENDYNIGPTQTLSAEATRMHKPHKSKIYPPYGTTNAEGHGGFCAHQTKIWSADVLAFLKQYL